VRHIYYGNKLAIIGSTILWFAISLLSCIPWILLDSFSPTVIAGLIGLTLVWSCFLAIRIKLVLVIDGEKIILYRALLSTKPVYLWGEIEEICYYPIINTLLLRTDTKHNVWIDPIIKDYKTAYRDVIVQALKSNSSIFISPSTLDKLYKNGIL
jgi:hypothetical protein